jgi:sarcosine oxidase subunit alpha
MCTSTNGSTYAVAAETGLKHKVVFELPVGKARYGVMLREDGIVMDDGTTTRISENHYHMTTTTAQAANILSHLEYYLQVVWPKLNVNVVSTTEQWAGAAIAGPKSRDVLQNP